MIKTYKQIKKKQIYFNVLFSINLISLFFLLLMTIFLFNHRTETKTGRGPFLAGRGEAGMKNKN
jgi:hypothetical protein